MAITVTPTFRIGSGRRWFMASEAIFILHHMFSFQEMRERREAERNTAEVSHFCYDIDVGNDHFLCLSLEVLTSPWSSKRFPCLDAQEMDVARNPGITLDKGGATITD